MSQKIFDTDLVPTRKNKVISKHNKSGYAEMCTLNLSKVLVYKFHNDYI